MNKWIRKMAGITMAVVMMAASLAGCQGNDNSTADTVEGTTTAGTTSAADGTQTVQKGAMGRYLEEEASLPEGTAEILDMAKQADGSVSMAIVSDSKNRETWSSGDGGQSWTKKADFPEEIRSVETSMLYNVALSPNGEIAVVNYTQEKGFFLQFADQSGTLKNLDLKFGGTDFSSGEGQESSGQESSGQESSGQESSDQESSGQEDSNQKQQGSANTQEMITYVRFDESGRLLGQGINGVYTIDPKTGEAGGKFAGGERVYMIGTAGNILVVITDKEVQLYDLSTNKMMEKDKVFEDQVKTNKNLEMAAETPLGKPLLISKGQDDQSIYFSDSSGLYHHTVGGTVCERIIDGELCMMGGPSMTFLSMAALDDQTFLIAYIDGSDYKVFHYTYSKDVPTVPDKELTAYALHDNAEIRQAVALYQKANPEVRITMQVGMTGEDAVTSSDALRTLNTDIMADKGPDILILDGMPVESYMEKGLLADLKEYLDPVILGDGILENVQAAYVKDEKVYAMPTRFKVPAYQTDKKTAESLKDLKGLADQAERLRKENPKANSVTSIFVPKIGVDILYNVCSQAWIKEDGSIDKDLLKDFLNQVKRIYDVDDHSYYEEDSYDFGEDDPASSPFRSITMGTIGLMGKNTLLGIGDIASMEDLAEVLSSNQVMGNMTYGMLNGQGSNVFVPGTIVGISSKGARQEEAGKFVAFLLSQENQEQSQGGGFPVNKAAFDEIWIRGESQSDIINSFSSSNNNSDEIIELEVKWPSEEETEAFKQYVKSLTNTPLMDEVIREEVEKEAVKLLNQDSALDDAVNNIIQKVNLYLME